MNRLTLILSILGLVCLSGTIDARPPMYFQSDPVSYAEVDLSKKNAAITNPTGTSSLKSVKLSSTSGATYNGVYGACWLTDKSGEGITFTLNVNTPGMVQLAMEIASVIQNQENSTTYSIKIGNTVLPGTPVTDTISSYHQVLYRIPGDLLNVGNNTIQVYLDASSETDLFVRNVKFLPQKITSNSGVLNTTLFTQFGETNQVIGVQDNNGNPINSIWTRGYGLSRQAEMIPGPTLFFKPGDLVNVNLVNLLNPDSNAVLKKYEELAVADPNGDDILSQVALKGELNIPHNLNNTNLHVHGLHVDPSKDDVTIVIIPEGETDADQYDAPHTHMPVSTLDSLNEFSVADQGVKTGEWKYEYKIPKIHLPGTHWFHPHKHGATSTQVENGLAGTIVIQEADSNAIVPVPGKPGSVVGGGKQTGYNLTDWQNDHDRVLAIQEITNFGAQPGKGNGKGSISQVSGSIDITINGSNDYQINIDKGQLERWRLVNAGTNHRAFSHIWLGKQTDQYITTYSKKKPSSNDSTKHVSRVYKSVPIYLAAVDGITLHALDTVTAENPALLAPGNRSDFLVQLEDSGTYVLFKNYGAANIAIEATNSNEIVYNSNEASSTTFWPAIANSKNNPYLFDQTGTTTGNFAGFTQQWNGKTAPVIPLIKVDTTTSGDFIDVQFANKTDDPIQNSVGKWQPGKNGGGAVDNAELMTVNVSDTAVASDSSPSMPSDTYLASIAPTTAWAPSYVSPISSTDILQSRPVIFDVSGVGFNVINTVLQDTNQVNQFTLNGRYFVLNDPIGNTKSDTILTRGFASATDVEYPNDTIALQAQEEITFVPAGRSGSPVHWGSNKSGDLTYFMNPGYYQTVDYDGSNYTYDASGGQTPNWEALTGLAPKGGVQRSSVLNKGSKFYADNNTHSLPLAQTAEEWIMVNNSDVSHPFHIHINPFFVVEVGQLTYENYTKSDGSQGTDWFMRAVTADTWGVKRDPMPATGAVPGSVYQGNINVDAIVGNWWDTIIIPAHGYVKVRYWFNVPNQTENNKGKVSVADNYNKTGIWVYHCHILRHEDRGMMMPVITMPRKTGDDD